MITETQINDKCTVHSEFDVRRQKPFYFNRHGELSEQNQPILICETLREVNDEDWKTALAQNKPRILKGEKVEVYRVLKNLYGVFAEVKYGGNNYSLKLSDLTVAAPTPETVGKSKMRD